MILVTIGMNEAPYQEMFRMMEEYSANTGEEVIMQIGHLEYHPKHCKTYTILPDAEMQELFDRCSLIVAHAGIGTITNGLNRSIPLVLVPRTVVLPDAESDQQYTVAKLVEKKGLGVCVDSLDELYNKIEEARKMKLPPYKKDRSLCDYLTTLLAHLETTRTKTTQNGH